MCICVWGGWHDSVGPKKNVLDDVLGCSMSANCVALLLERFWFAPLAEAHQTETRSWVLSYCQRLLKLVRRAAVQPVQPVRAAFVRLCVVG